MIITAFDVDTRIPSISRLETGDRNSVESAQDFVRTFVPQSVWDEVDIRHERFMEENKN